MPVKQANSEDEVQPCFSLEHLRWQFFVEYKVTTELRQGRVPVAHVLAKFALLSPYGGMRILFFREQEKKISSH